MSYDIQFVKDGEVCRLPFPPPQGGTFCPDEGFAEAWLNITFNYGGVFARHGLSVIRREEQTRGIKTLEGKTAAECVRILTTVIPQLGDDVSADYWEATEGNAKRALVNLLTIAITVPPDATCRVWH